VQVFDAQMNLTTTDVSGMPALKRLQVNDLFERCDPKWKLEMNEIPALVRARYPFMDAATVRGTSDSLCGQLGSFHDAVGEILFAAVEVYRSVEHGGDQDRLLENLRETIGRVNLRRAVIEIKGDTGRTLPTYEQALEEGLRLYGLEDTINVLAYRNAEQERLQAIVNRITDDEDYQREFLGQKPADSVTYASASNGYQGYLDEGQARRLARIATLTQDAYLASTDRHVQLAMAVSGLPNVQREYAIAMAGNSAEVAAIMADARREMVQATQSGVITSHGMLVALDGLMGEVGGIWEQFHGAASITENIGTFSEADYSDMAVSMTPGGQHSYTFTLTEPAMVNVGLPGIVGEAQGPWVDCPPVNYALRLTGGPDHVDYAHGRGAASAETISAAAGIDLDVEGITVIGLGNGDNRPTFTMDTSTSVDEDVDADNITIKGLRFVSGKAAMLAMIDVNNAFFEAIDCDFISLSTFTVINFINIPTTKDNFRFKGCRFISATDPDGTDGGANTGCFYIVDSENIRIEDCEFYGNFETAIFHNKTTACKNLWVINCYGIQSLSGAEPFQLVDGANGAMVGGGFITPAEAAATEATLVGTLGDAFFILVPGNFGNDGVSGGQGGIIVATAS